MSQLHRTGPDGNRPVQAVEDAAPEQRPHLLLSVPDLAWSEVHPLGERSTPRPETVKPVAQHYL